MKNTFFWTFFLALVLVGSYTGGRRWKELRQSSEQFLSIEQDNGFRPAAYPLEQKPFALVLFGHNNGAYLERTLRSLFSQVYDNYRLIYVDDASTDGSFELARECIEEGGKNRSTLLRNEERLGELASLQRAAKLCHDEEILVVLREGEWLAHEWALDRLNRYFVDPDLWLSYAQMREFPSYRSGPQRPLKQQEWLALRAATLSFGLKAFYTGLFRKIQEEDLAYPLSADLALMFPLLEMARDHCQFLPETLSIAGSSEERDLKSEKIVRSLKPYEPLQELVLSTEGA